MHVWVLPAAAAESAPGFVQLRHLNVQRRSPATRCFAGAVFAAFCTVNAVIATTTASTMAAPPSLYLFLAALWLAVGVPLTFLGGALALCVRIPPWPGATAAEPQEVPPQTRAAYQQTVLMYVFLDFVPAYLISMELAFVMEAAWRGYFYGLYGVFATLCALTVLIVMAISVLNTCATPPPRPDRAPM